MPVGRDGEMGEQGLEKKDCICQPPSSVPPQLPVSRAGAAALHREQHSDRVCCPHTVKHTTRDKVWVYEGSKLVTAESVEK